MNILTIKYKLNAYLAIICLLLCAGNLKGQQESSYAVHANIMYHFTKYIDWPNSKKSGDFVIGVIGSSDVYDALVKSTAHKMVGYQPIVIKKMSSSASSFPCHILFIDADKSSLVKKIASVTEDLPLLLVSELNGMAQQGACINFVVVNDRLTLEINKKNIELRKLNIANELLSLGKIIK